MNNHPDKNRRFESYPRPTETDNQMKNQPEYIDEINEEKNEQSETVKVSRPEKEEEKKEDDQ